MSTLPQAIETECTDDASAVRFLEELVRVPSLSGDEDGAAARFIAEAQRLGMRGSIDDTGNAIAERGPENGAPLLVLLGHIDTVPGDVPVRIADDILHGRGSVDAKGPLATLLYGAARAELPDNARVVVVGAVGEETHDSPGAHAILDRWRPDACIIGEPSGWDGVTLGYKGRLVVEATLRRESAHSAAREGSAADALIAWWQRLLERLREIDGDRIAMFDTVQATIMAMQSDDSGMHAEARMTCGFRLPPAVSPDLLTELLNTDVPDDMTIQCTGATVASRTTRSDVVVSALSSAIRNEGGSPTHKVKSGTADLNVVAPVWQCPIAAYGPGDSAFDHTPQEQLPLADFRAAIRVVTGAVERLSALETPAATR